MRLRSAPRRRVVAKARADLAQSRANRKQVDISAAQASSANAGVQQARANLAAAELQLSYATIVAPVDGVVTRKIGATRADRAARPGPHDRWCRFTTCGSRPTSKRRSSKTCTPGQRAEVNVDMYGKTFPGRVDSIAGATGTRISLLPPENATGNYVKVVQRIPVKITLDSLPAGIRAPARA